MLLDNSIKQLATLLKTKETSSKELVEESLSSIKALNPKINAFISVKQKEDLVKEAEASDNQRDENAPLLHGLPFAMKDAYVTKEIRSTAASKVLDDFMSPYDATVYTKIKQQGAILVGKNNQDAWGHGGSTENTDYGVGKNPWNTEHTPGGSSGGSAASVVSRMVSFAVGEDTGGSIRNPSSMCNTSGLKVTYGRVSRYGAIAYASSLDTVGPIAKTVEDLTLLMEIMAGQDKHDATSSHRPVDQYSQFLENSIKGKTIGLPKEFFGEGLDKEVKEIIETAAKKFESMGVNLVEVSLPYVKYGVSIYYLICLSETSSNLGRYDGIRYGFDRSLFTDETKRRIILGTHALSAGYADELYIKAQKARTGLITQFNQALNKCDILLAPITPSQPAKIGELINDPLKSFLEDLYTGPVNVVGAPSLAIPAGFTQAGLPVGLQLIGKKFDEKTILNFGHQYQQVTDWHTKKPPILGK